MVKKFKIYDQYIKVEPIDFTYYAIKNDIEAHPDAWLFGCVGGRNTGKTYGALDYYREIGDKFMFVKRTNDDVDILCNRGKGDAKNDVSPYKSINRDKGCNIKPVKFDKGFGGFFPFQDEDIAGEMLAYIMSLHAIGKYKGADFSDAMAILFDEFIPKPSERTDRDEGEQLLDLYKTVSRDRVLRGKPELKLILLANATNVYNPTMAVLGLIDVVSYMNAIQANAKANGHIVTVTYYDPKRKIFLRLLPMSEDMKKAEEHTGFYQTLKDTDWGRMAWDNEFAFNDFTCVQHCNLKGYKPYCSVHYKGKTYYIYNSEEGYYMCMSKFNHDAPSYNLNIESQQRKFYYDYAMYLYEAILDGRMFFAEYTMYDLIFNYKLRFKVT